jgi:hypothetical protein
MLVQFSFVLEIDYSVSNSKYVMSGNLNGLLQYHYFKHQALLSYAF